MLENHHAASAFALMQKPGFNILESLEPEAHAYVRSIMIAMVLSTDMTKHFKFLGDFKTLTAKKKSFNAVSPLVPYALT